METPKHRGRPKGSSSFVNVSINDLVQLLPSEKTAVVVSKKWLDDLTEARELLGLTVGPLSVVSSASKTTLDEDDQKIEFTINTFD